LECTDEAMLVEHPAEPLLVIVGLLLGFAFTHSKPPPNPSASPKSWPHFSGVDVVVLQDDVELPDIEPHPLSVADFQRLKVRLQFSIDALDERSLTSSFCFFTIFQAPHWEHVSG
jgi:hypothetical protein